VLGGFDELELSLIIMPFKRLISDSYFKRSINALFQTHYLQLPILRLSALSNFLIPPAISVSFYAGFPLPPEAHGFLSLDLLRRI
jgi:hypothetical protein